MYDFIKKEKALQNSRDSYFNQPMLVKEIEGIITNHIIIPKGCKQTVKPQKDQLVVLLLIGGNGYIEASRQQFDFQNIAVFIPELESSISIKPKELAIKYMEISIQLNSPDKQFYQKYKNKYPYFKRYMDCKPYREEIKSEKTISRMIVPEDIVPRLSIGSVQTTGPDTVGAHEHPMLDQLFYGLERNSCYVFADNHEIHFGESELLHIPLGSNHGVRVDKGNHLHYIWIDFFNNQADMSYITDAHSIEEDR